MQKTNVLKGGKFKMAFFYIRVYLKQDFGQVKFKTKALYFSQEFYANTFYIGISK